MPYGRSSPVIGDLVSLYKESFAKFAEILSPGRYCVIIVSDTGLLSYSTDFKFKVFGKEYTPQQISAYILQKIKRDAEQYLGEPSPNSITVTSRVPPPRSKTRIF